jgi:hypothetical protein
LTILTAISPRQPGSVSCLNHSPALPTERCETCGMLMPATNTLRDARFSRVPSQSGHGFVPRYFASSSRTIIESVSR